ncbi:MAG: hypothetical protein Q4E53_06305 [Eubacteriales bacterium]|nr:hypothetical protein [Eubacteriales bacterium]
MMKKRFVLATFAVLAIAAVGCAKKSKSPKEEITSVKEAETKEMDTSQSVETTEQEYPKIVFIDNVLYYGSNEECLQVPRKMADGTIETFYAKEIMPDAPNSANFGSENEKMEYMFLEDGQLIVHDGEAWFYFEKEAADSICE